jgi:DNA-binding NtrC family response regulator
MLILVASAKPNTWHRVKKALGQGFAISYSVDLKGTLAVIKGHRPSLVVLWSSLLDADMEKSIRCIRRIDQDLRVIGITTGDSAPQTDADACLSEEEVPGSLLDAVNALVGSEVQKPESKPVASLAAYRNMVVGKSPQFLRQMQIASRIAAVDVNVLINGESGTGKEVMARWIHCSSHRARGPFEAVDLPSIPDELFESILFGHERGAFTGATAQNQGSFKRAQRGTLFLDEISSLKLDLQPKLLRAIQEREARSVGGQEPMPCDVRIIAATNANLKEAVKRGEFRSDLFYRLNVVALDLIPLRQRKDDIPALLELFINRYTDRFNRKTPEVSGEARRALHAYNWPGNIRELENRVQRALLLSRSDRLSAEDFFDEPHTGAGEPPIQFGECNRNLADVERLYINWVLQKTNGNQSQAAQILQIDRKTLRNKLRSYSEQDLRDEPVLQSIS